MSWQPDHPSSSAPSTTTTPLLSHSPAITWSERRQQVVKALEFGTVHTASCLGVMVLTLLLIPNGNWRWKRMWIWTIVSWLEISISQILIEWYRDPSSTAKSPTSCSKNTKDQIGTVLTVAMVVSMWISAPITVFWWQPGVSTSESWIVGDLVPLIGFALAFLGVAIIQLASFQNSFATSKPDHTLINTGLYAHVRHPMYTGLLVYGVGFPLCFGSLPSLIFVVLLVPCLYARMDYEESFLSATVPGYSEYRGYVKARLFPGIM